jgi:hypothetical protein
MALLLLWMLQGCGCTTGSNRLIVGYRPQVRTSLKASDLRYKINPSPSCFARAAGFVTTPFKRAGIFGWRDLHINVMVIGVVQQVATSTDHFVTADLLVSELTANGRPVVIRDDRYMRVEICARRLRLATASRPCPADKVRVSGRLLWDSDGKGFLEVHPQRASDVEILDRVTSCVIRCN